MRVRSGSTRSGGRSAFVELSEESFQLLSKGNITRAQDKIKEAENQLFRFVSKEKQKELHLDIASMYYIKGLIFDRLNKTDLSQLAYEEAFKRNQHNQSVCNNLGKIYLQQKNYKPAEELFIQALQLNAKLTQPYVNLANLYFEQGLYLDCIHVCKEAERLDVKDNILNEYMGICNFQINSDYKAASANLAAYLNGCAVKATTPNYLAIYYAALTDFYLNDLDRAFAHVEQALKLYPDFLDLLFLRAQINLARNNLNEAETDILDFARRTNILSPLAEKYHNVIEGEEALIDLNGIEIEVGQIDIDQSMISQPVVQHLRVGFLLSMIYTKAGGGGQAKKGSPHVSVLLQRGLRWLCVTKELDENKANVAVFVNEGVVLEQMGETKKAFEAFSGALMSHFERSNDEHYLKSPEFHMVNLLLLAVFELCFLQKIAENLCRLTVVTEKEQLSLNQSIEFNLSVRETTTALVKNEEADMPSLQSVQRMKEVKSLQHEIVREKNAVLDTLIEQINELNKRKLVVSCTQIEGTEIQQSVIFTKDRVGSVFASSFNEEELTANINSSYLQSCEDYQSRKKDQSAPTSTDPSLKKLTDTIGDAETENALAVISTSAVNGHDKVNCAADQELQPQQEAVAAETMTPTAETEAETASEVIRESLKLEREQEEKKRQYKLKKKQTNDALQLKKLEVMRKEQNDYRSKKFLHYDKIKQLQRCSDDLLEKHRSTLLERYRDDLPQPLQISMFSETCLSKSDNARDFFFAFKRLMRMLYTHAHIVLKQGYFWKRNITLVSLAELSLGFIPLFENSFDGIDNDDMHLTVLDKKLIKKQCWFITSLADSIDDLFIVFDTLAQQLSLLIVDSQAGGGVSKQSQPPPPPMKATDAWREAMQNLTSSMKNIYEIEFSRLGEAFAFYVLFHFLAKFRESVEAQEVYGEKKVSERPAFLLQFIQDKIDVRAEALALMPRNPSVSSPTDVLSSSEKKSKKKVSSIDAMITPHQAQATASYYSHQDVAEYRESNSVAYPSIIKKKTSKTDRKLNQDKCMCAVF